MTTSAPKEPSETRALLWLAGPLVLSQIAQVLTGMVDTVMAGQAGPREQAVVALGVALWIPLYVGLMNVVQAVSPIVAQHHGAGDVEAVGHQAREGMWLAAWVSLVPLALLPFAPALLRLAGIEPALAERTGVFLTGIGLGLPAAMLFRALSFYSAAIGQTRPIAVLAFVGLGLNAALNEVLIHGHFGLPAMGGAGCGWATGIGMWVSLAGLALWTRRAAVYRPYPVWRWRGPTRTAQVQMLRLGLPMGGAGFAEVSAFAGIAVMIGRFGAEQIAAHQSALNFSALTFMLPMGLSTAIAIRVGHAIGAGDPVRARRTAWTGVALGLAIAAIVTGPIVLFRDPIATIYSSDPTVRAIAANLLLFAAGWHLFDALQVCAIGALRGYKITLMPMVLMVLAFWGIGVPAGAWLGYRGWPGHAPLEVYGFWVGLVIGLIVVSVALAVALRRVADREARRAENPAFRSTLDRLAPSAP